MKPHQIFWTLVFSGLALVIIVKFWGVFLFALLCLALAMVAFYLTWCITDFDAWDDYKKFNILWLISAPVIWSIKWFNRTLDKLVNDIKEWKSTKM